LTTMLFLPMAAEAAAFITAATADRVSLSRAGFFCGYPRISKEARAFYSL
jgi:hypothetical protein